MSNLALKEPPEILLDPVLKWAGGKRWLVPRLNQIFKNYSDIRLVEPFVGGMAVALGLTPKQALLADANLHLINFYKCLQNNLQIDPEIKFLNDSQVFYQHRQRFNFLIEQGQALGAEAASLFYYLNRTCFNGLCRFNSKGLFNVPFGKYSKINYRRDFFEYVAVVKNWHFENCDFEKLEIKSNDFIYADPPYDVEFTRYSKDDFKWDDQIRLAKWLAEHKGPIVFSNQATPRIIDLYQSLGFQYEILSAPRRIASNGDRTAASEVLGYKNL